MNTQEIRNLVEQKKGQKRQLDKNLAALNTTLKEMKRELIRLEQAREIIREVGQKTQSQLSYHISDITTLAMEAVFADPYQLQVDFVQRRNKTECDLSFVRNENVVNPLSAAGGGAVDFAAFALRIASWSMSRPRTRNTIILDEPLRFLSAENQERASAMIKELSKRLNLQFIIITHEPILTTYADKIFEVSQTKKGISSD